MNKETETISIKYIFFVFIFFSQRYFYNLNILGQHKTYKQLQFTKQVKRLPAYVISNKSIITKTLLYKLIPIHHCFPSRSCSKTWTECFNG